MATEIDKFIFSLALDSTQFKKGEKDTLAAIKNIRNAFTTTYQLIGGVKLLGGIIQDFKNLNLQMDALAKRTGESATALDKWGRAAERLGQNKNSVLNDIDRIALMFNSPQQKLELFSKLPLVGLGTGEAATAKSATDLLFKIAAASKTKFNTPAERAAALQNYLGLSPDTIGMMLNTNNLRKYVGGMSSRVNQASIDSSSALQEELVELRDSLDDLKDTLLTSIVPVLNKIVPELNNFIKGDWYNPVNGWMDWQTWKPFGTPPEDVKKRYKAWAEALGVKAMDPDAKMPGFSILHPYDSMQRQMDYLLTPQEQAGLDLAIAGSLGMASVWGKNSGMPWLSPGKGGFVKGSYPKGVFSKFKSPGGFERGDSVLTRDEYKYFLSREKIRFRDLKEILGDAFIPGKSPSPFTGSLEELAAIRGKIPESALDILYRNIPFQGTLYGAGALAQGGLYMYDFYKYYHGNVPGGKVNSPVDITVENPTYSVNISTNSDNLESIAAAAKEGVEAANNNLSGMLYRSMKDMTYGGAGMERYSPPASR